MKDFKIDPINVEFIDNLMKDAGTGIMTVIFYKKDGSIRKLNGMTGVKKHLKGGESTIKHHDNLVSIYDVKNKGYRCFDKNRVKEIRFRGKVYKFF